MPNWPSELLPVTGESGEKQGYLLEEILNRHSDDYIAIENKCARLSFEAARRRKTSQYQRIQHEARLDDARFELEELETRISQSLFSRIHELLEENLNPALLSYLRSSKKRKPNLSSDPKRKKTRKILYRMYRGGSFYPLIFPRDIAHEFFLALAKLIERQGMRGKEIAAKTRKIALRSGYDIAKDVDGILSSTKGIKSMGKIKWSWRRNRIRRRPAYCLEDSENEARRILDIMQKALERRSIPSKSRRKRI